MPLRVIFHEYRNPYLNIAFEESLARSRGVDLVDDTLRIWKNENSLILGRFRKVEGDINVGNAGKLGFSIVRRFTGGGTVYHDNGCLNYSLAIKRDVRYPVDYMYKVLLNGTLLALKKLGITPYLKNTNDVVINERKVSGTAAAVRWGVLFLHGSILVNSNLQKLYLLLRIPKTHNFDPVKYRVANLSAFVEASMEEVADALVWGYSRVLSTFPTFEEPLKEEIKVADILYKGKYSRDEWNFKGLVDTERELNKKVKDILS
ncbi:MAG: lipoate---protein ligase [Thermococcaceae archaeon]|jgi:lipoate-protein ligase A|nr:MAG: Biotin/lipoate A/B protein ligase [Thermococcales archaeon 44_46]MDK2782713.1 lipoate---protein ligase [Thermococcaceae archaeon]MDK2853435.1 lipoate---protein ligase [Thermococcaceae archaeon]MDK2982973.1 lipoate---protein ligase [Thermococcaceae archaeon]MDN5319647.1 lipoate---protein ligase [Thermococcaceae archaeon]